MSTSEKVTRAELGRILTAKGPINLSLIPTTYRSNGWYVNRGRLRWHTPNNEKAIELLNIHDKNPPLLDLDILFTENRMPTNSLDREWVLARLDELPFVLPPEMTKAEIKAEIDKRGEIKRIVGADSYGTSSKWYQYGDRVHYDVFEGRHVVKAFWIRLPLTEPGDITFIKNRMAVNTVDTVWALARLDELSYTTAAQTEMCMWIKSLMAKGLTEDHGRYVYQLAKGRATLAAQILTFMRATPFMLPTIKVTEDIGRAIYQYAKGRKSLGNKITGCNI